LEVTLKRVANCFSFPLPQQTVVDKDARDLRTDGLDEQSRTHGRIDAARQSANDAVLANAAPQFGDRLLDERFQPPLPRATAYLVKKIAENSGAVRRVADLGMELQAEHRLAAMANRCHGTRRCRSQRHKILIDDIDLVAVTHPD